MSIKVSLVLMGTECTDKPPCQTVASKMGRWAKRENILPFLIKIKN